MDIPNTVNYMVAGFIVIFSGLLAYVASLWLRSRRLAQEEILLKEIQSPNRSDSMIKNSQGEKK